MASGMDVPRSIPMTEPLTFSSVDSKRANAGVMGLRRNAEREAAEVALGSCETVSYELIVKRATGLTALERREASILTCVSRTASM